MVFHALGGAPPGTDVEQLVCTLREPFDADRFEDAFRQVVARHDALRAEVRLDGMQPGMIARSSVDVVLDVFDLRELPANERESAFREAVMDDRDTGFDLTQAPLHRLSAFRLSDHEWRIVWTVPHVVVDGRAFPVVLGEVFALYDAPPGDRVLLAEPRAMHEYLSAIASRDGSGDEAFWRRAFDGVAPPPPVLPDASERRGTLLLDLRLDEAATARVAEAADAIDVRPSTLVAGAWALAVANGAQGTVIGMAVTPRLANNATLAECVGCCMQAVPFPVPLPRAVTVAEWLRAIRTQQYAMRQHAAAPTADIRRWAGLPAGSPGYDAMLVFDFDSLQSAMNARLRGSPPRAFDLLEETGLPLTLYTYAERRMLFRLSSVLPAIPERYAVALLRAVAGYTLALADAPLRRLGEVRPVNVGDPVLAPYAEVLHRGEVSPRSGLAR